MPLIEQLEKLRRRLIAVVVLFLVVGIIGYSFSDQLFAIATSSFTQAAGSLEKGTTPGGSAFQDSLIFITPLEAFTARLKLAFYTAFLITIPLFFYIVWAGIAYSGLFDRRYIWLLSLSCTFFWWCGAAFAFFVVVPLALKFFLGFATAGLNATWSVGKYTGFFIQGGSRSGYRVYETSP